MPKVNLSTTPDPETKLGTLTKLGDNLTVFSAPSTSRPGTSHFVVVYPDERGITCTCEGWRYNRHCWHMEAVPLCMVDNGNKQYHAAGLSKTFNMTAFSQCHHVQGHGGPHSWET